MIDTGGTADKIMESAALVGLIREKSVSMFCSHGVLSGAALEIINKSHIDELVITDTINNQNN